MDKRKEPTILIGIGGLGVNAVDILKKKIQEEMEKETQTEDVEEYAGSAGEI